MIAIRGRMRDHRLKSHPWTFRPIEAESQQHPDTL